MLSILSILIICLDIIFLIIETENDLSLPNIWI